MKIVELKCPNCGATVMQDEEGKKLFCEYCGTRLIAMEERSSVRLEDAEDTGYRFEMGRIRAQREAERQSVFKRGERSAPLGQIVINNFNAPSKHEASSRSVNTNAANQAAVNTGKEKNKWTAFLLCLLFGYFGLHKFYEGKTGMGILYLFTVGLFCIGWIVDIFAILAKPNPYYV